VTQRAACAQVPLGRRFESVLEPEQRFSPQLVTEHLAKRGIEVTLLALLALSPPLPSRQAPHAHGPGGTGARPDKHVALL